MLQWLILRWELVLPWGYHSFLLADFVKAFMLQLNEFDVVVAFVLMLQ
jgi:hypothetical protein